jgi:hypothetical protein
MKKPKAQQVETRTTPLSEERQRQQLLGQVGDLLDTVKDLREPDPRWLFPRGIDLIDVKVELAGAKVELRLSGSSQGAEAGGQLSDITLDSVDRALQFARAMERIAPPRPTLDRSAPTAGPIATDPPTTPADPVTLEAVARYWTKECQSGDLYENNCAHFLSDAMVRSGFVDLNPPADCINARCETLSRRPIRARDMWCWFKSKATKTASQPTKNTGWWAVFQLDEQVYWGGHVVLLDSDNWRYYGTAWYADWKQHLYQW